MITLETLRADYDEALDSFVAAKDHWIPGSGGFDRALDSLNAKSAMWNIASKYGLPAAVLYKLSDGTIDPRKEKK